jgi:hypothetical protein
VQRFDGRFPHTLLFAKGTRPIAKPPPSRRQAAAKPPILATSNVSLRQHRSLSANKWLQVATTCLFVATSTVLRTTRRQNDLLS